MKTSERRNGDGIGTARAVLSLIDEHSARDFEAAESILGGSEKLARLVQLLRELKEKEEAANEPLTVETFAWIVRRELLALPLSGTELAEIVGEMLQVKLHLATVTEDVVDSAISFIHARAPSPGEEVTRLARCLLSSASRAGIEHEGRIFSLLKKLAIQAVVENLVVLPALHSIAQLRLAWAAKPLSFSPHETREHLAERLLKDLDRLTDNEAALHTIDVLVQGLRMPAGGSIAAVRGLGLRKGTRANGK